MVLPPGVGDVVFVWCGLVFFVFGAEFRMGRVSGRVGLVEVPVEVCAWE